MFRDQIIIFSILLISCLYPISSIRDLVFYENTTRVIYECSSRFSIFGKGFEQINLSELRIKLIKEENIELGKEFLQNKDFLILETRNDQELVLTFICSSLHSKIFSRSVVYAHKFILSEVKMSRSSQNILSAPVQIGILQGAPAIKEFSFLQPSTLSPFLPIRFYSIMNSSSLDLIFDPPLIRDIDYTYSFEFPIVEENVQLSLLPRRKWRETSGYLKLMSIDTGGGPILCDGKDGVAFAKILDETEFSDRVKGYPDGLFLYSSKRRIYESILSQNISLRGNGFNSKITNFEFYPPMVKGIDYDLSSISTSGNLELTLKPGKKWKGTNGEGLIYMLALFYEDEWYYPPEGSVTIAIIARDPMIIPSKQLIYETQTKLIRIDGIGLGISWQPTIPRFFPSWEANYNVHSNDDSSLFVTSSSSWLPPQLSFHNSSRKRLSDSSDTQIPLQVVSLGAFGGLVHLNPPVTVGIIIPDIEGVVCDDSCYIALDGMCDDGSRPNSFLDEETGQIEQFMDSYCERGTDCTDCGGVESLRHRPSRVRHAKLRGPE
jgi:hypothetical protein